MWPCVTALELRTERRKEKLHETHYPEGNTETRNNTQTETTKREREAEETEKEVNR